MTAGIPAQSDNDAISAENSALSARLEEANELLAAIRRGDVDALVVQSETGPMIYTLQGQETETNRIRGDMLAQVSDAVVARGPDDRILYLNTAAEALYGVPASDAYGRAVSELRSTLWSSPGSKAAAKRSLREHGAWRGEIAQIRHDGHLLNVEVTVTVLRTPEGEANGFLSIIRDITDRKRGEQKLLISEIRYRRLFETAHDGVLIIDPDTSKIIDANPFMTQMLGYRHDQLVGKELFEIGLLKDEGASREMFARLRRYAQVRYDDLPLKSQNGQHHEVEVVANLYDENGRPVIQCNIRDVTERKRSEAHVQLLMAEVNHRAKNLLAVVQAVTRQTAKYGDPVTFASRLCERIDGLAAGQDLLVRNQWQGVELAELVHAQLAHFQDLVGSRIHISGKSKWLTAAAAQGIGMALHELTTNAAKYGALSNADGEVQITWKISTGPERVFQMVWLEQGGPPVKPPTRKGFGGIILGRMAEAAVDGIVEIAFNTSGVAWTLRAPAANVMAPRRPVASDAAS